MWTPWYPGSNDHNLQLLTVEVLMTDNDSERVSAPLRAALAEFGTFLLPTTLREQTLSSKLTSQH
jgi:hypothetical protein